eukprot:g21325.t1
MGAISKEKMVEKLKELKADKPPGPNGLHPRVVKKIAEEIVEALVVIFQEPLETMESIVKDEITKYLEYHCMEIISMLDQGEPMDVIDLDFEEAFDKMLHGRLLKIRAHGVGGKVLAWIEDWLTGRRRREWVLLRMKA